MSGSNHATGQEAEQGTLFTIDTEGVVTIEERFIIVCGGRDYVPRWSSYAWLWNHCEAYRATGIREGGATGGDAVGRIWAQRTGMSLDTMPADWERHGKAAGAIRNREMARKIPRPVAVLAFPGNRGTENMIEVARAAGISVQRYVPDREETDAIIARHAEEAKKAAARAEAAQRTRAKGDI